MNDPNSAFQGLALISQRCNPYFPGKSVLFCWKNPGCAMPRTRFIEVKVIEKDELTKLQILQSLNWKCMRFKSCWKLLLTQIFSILYPFKLVWNRPQNASRVSNCSAGNGLQAYLQTSPVVALDLRLWASLTDLVKTRGVKKLNSTDFHSVEVDV